MRQQATPRARRGLTIALTAAAIAASSAVAVAAFRDSGTQVQIPTTAQDFFQPGTQPDPTSTTLR